MTINGIGSPIGMDDILAQLAEMDSVMETSARHARRADREQADDHARAQIETMKKQADMNLAKGITTACVQAVNTGVAMASALSASTPNAAADKTATTEPNGPDWSATVQAGMSTIGTAFGAAFEHEATNASRAGAEHARLENLDRSRADDAHADLERAMKHRDNTIDRARELAQLEHEIAMSALRG